MHQLFPRVFLRRLAQQQMGTVPDEVPGSHCAALNRPKEPSDLLLSYLGPEVARRVTDQPPEDGLDPVGASYFVSRIMLGRTNRPGMGTSRKQVFIALAHNAPSNGPPSSTPATNRRSSVRTSHEIAGRT